MDLATSQMPQPSKEPAPSAELDALVRAELETAVYAEQQGSKVYESLHNLNEVIGTQYGDRVLYELIQNAHDAHGVGDNGRICIRLVVRSPSEGALYVANAGKGFKRQNVESIRNLATSDKEIGEGIGNKGLGFRSIEALTDDVRIYSQTVAIKSDRFDGYCFRFASPNDIDDLLRSNGVETEIRQKVALTIPPYLVPRPLSEQPDDIIAFARSGYATVVMAPLASMQAVALATEQVQSLADLEVPLLLFLDRIGKVRIDVELPGQSPFRRVLRRRQSVIGNVPGDSGFGLFEVDVGERRRFLIVSSVVCRERVLDAVERSIPFAPQLKRWRNWKGDPVVSVAVGLGTGGGPEGRLFNFLPMGETVVAPLMGYLDAPFFADIDRRNADLDLPLNETLVEAAAEACVGAALFMVDEGVEVPSHAVFDLIAWTGEKAGKLDDALEKIGSSLGKARVIPVIPVDGQGSWSSLSEISLWPNEKFSLLKARDLARYVGAQLVSQELDEKRIQRLKDVARRAFPFRSLSPTAARLADWVETFAQSLSERKVGPRTWSRFYDDMVRAFKAVGAELEVLSQKLILFDRSGKLRPAGGHSSGSRTAVYVRSQASKGKRTSEGMPVPPSTLTRRYRFLHDKITLPRETLEALVEADLVRQYDPVEALAGLKSALGRKANDKRRQEALLWAFRVWRVAGNQVEDLLCDADLHVPTLSGWQPARQATFSSSWTALGRKLENFLFEAAEVSTDCRRERERLLIAHQDWPGSSQESKRRWVQFLEVIGVADGLRPIPSRLRRNGIRAYVWDGLLQNGNASEGFDDAWCAEVEQVSFNHPNTDYEIDGEAWRFPGQIEHDQLPETAKEVFCTLVLEHLKANGDSYFHFDVGRFERAQRDWDSRRLPTPLATFLRSKGWIATNTREGVDFRRPDECWGARTRRGVPPRFIDRVPEVAADVVETEDLADLVFGDAIGLRDWQSKSTAVDRLMHLAALAPELPLSDRPRFRDEYRRAWVELIDVGSQLPEDCQLAINRRGQLETLVSDSDIPPSVVVTQDGQRFEARILSAAGRPVLEVGEASVQEIASALEVTGGFKPQLLDGIGVQLLVDGEPFVPSATDPLLTSFGLDWLPEVVVIANELRGERLERGIPSASLEKKTQAIRLRLCERISLVVEGEGIAPSEELPYYAFEHDELSTLILTERVSLTWRTLALELSVPVSRLIDTRLRALERVLYRLAFNVPSDELDKPSDEVLAYALECDLQTVAEHRLALRTDVGRILDMLVPVVAYFGGVELAGALMTEADREGLKFDVEKWLAENAENMEGAGHSPDELLAACERAGDRVELRRQLELDYATFNRVLVELGEPPLSNEEELRQLYAAYLAHMGTDIIDRLRRRYVEDFRNGRDLDAYVERKSLDFLSFNTDWVLTRETLDMETVEEHVSQLLDEAIGEDVPLELPPRNRVAEVNRRTLRRFAKEAMPVVRAWCRKHDAPVPSPWLQDETQAVLRHIEDKGLLDFEIIAGERMPALCLRAGCWPENMLETIDRGELDLAESEVEEEEKRREKERRCIEIARRTIEFGERALDTGDARFAETLQEIAEEWVSGDESWFKRSSRRVRLTEFLNPERSLGGGGGKGKGGRKRERQLTEAQRTAMGLASEWLALQYLRRRHPDYVDEACWISQNRAHFFSGDEGDDSAGYDFRVRMPQADWMYEVKSSLEDSGEFDLTANELRVASGASKDGRRRYRILYVPYVFSPDKWYVLELPNPMGERTRNQFETIGRGSVRMRFERR